MVWADGSHGSDASVVPCKIPKSAEELFERIGRHSDVVVERQDVIGLFPGEPQALVKPAGGSFVCRHLHKGDPPCLSGRTPPHTGWSCPRR